MRWARVVVAGFAVSAMSCLAPTEIMLVLSTDVACAVVAQNGVAIAIGEPGDEDSGIAASTKLCADDGGIGTLALLPHASVDQPIGIRVTLGIDASADACGPQFEGCIVARRSLRFDPHVPLTLPIDLDRACIGVPCTPNSTCVSGLCVDAGVECDGSSCGIEDAGVADVADAAPPCQVVNDTLVASDTGQGASRVTLSSDGWAVAYQTPQLGVEIRDIHVFNNTPNVSTAVTLVAAGNTNVIGPLGSDGTSYALSYTIGNSAYATIVATDGTPMLTGPFAFASAAPAHYGMFSLGSSNYSTAFISGSNTDGLVIPFGKQIGANGPGLNTTGVREIAFAHGATSFYATTADASGTCSIYKCDYTSSFVCAKTATTFSQQCAAMRVAERSGNLSSVVQSGTVLTIDDAQQLIVGVLGSSFNVIAASDLFHVVYAGTTNAIIIAGYPDSTTAPTIQSYPANGGGSLLFVDVVPDGPTQTGYAIAYTEIDSVSHTNVRFMHLCK